MIIEAKYLDISFDKAGIRNSQKRLKELIDELAITPLTAFQDQLRGDFELVEEILMKRIANVISHWCQHKNDPVKPSLYALMNDITNARRDNGTLESFYKNQVTNALHTLAPQLNLDVPESYDPPTDELEFALLELEEKFEHHGMREVIARSSNYTKEEDSDDEAIYNFDDYNEDDDNDNDEGDYYPVAKIVTDTPKSFNGNGANSVNPPRDKSITVSMPKEIQENKPSQIEINVLNITSQQAWQMVYELMGFKSDYVQSKMLPRWQQAPDSFEKDRRFLYNLFIQTLKNATGTQMVAGNFSFSDQQMSVDNLWQYYLADLTQNVGPQLVVARFDTATNLNSYQRIWQTFSKNFENFSFVWLIALVVALIFDGLTTYVSLDQTPMDGPMVWMFTILITILFQIADLLVISYRKREFEADGMRAKYGAKYAQLSKLLESLDTTSDSYVQLIIERSQAHADWKSAEDNRSMSRRGRFWSARIADINVAVTAYGFAFMFLNAEEPMAALTRQIEAIVSQQWANIDPWVFLMIGMAITVSFVINTAQRTEIMGWSMRRMKNDV